MHCCLDLDASLARYCFSFNEQQLRASSSWLGFDPRSSCEIKHLLPDSFCLSGPLSSVAESLTEPSYAAQFAACGVLVPADLSCCLRASALGCL